MASVTLSKLRKGPGAAEAAVWHVLCVRCVLCGGRPVRSVWPVWPFSVHCSASIAFYVVQCLCVRVICRAGDFVC